MTTISEAYINAVLADATYALDDTVGNEYPKDKLQDILKTRMTPTLAKYISDNFTVVTHKATNDLLESGFDATVWQDNTTKKFYVSMTGTEGLGSLGDVLTDIDLTVSGVAGTQIIDMVNWWLKNTTALGQDALQIKRFSHLLDGNEHEFTEDRFISAPTVTGTGVLSDITGLSVNGHSLGGHLATAFTRLFGKQWPVEHTYTYNSAGFNGGSDKLLDQISAILGPNVGSETFAGDEGQSNFYAEHGISITTQNWFGGQQGRRIALFNEESGNPLNNHSMYKLSDALALGSLIESIDNSFDIVSMNTLFNRGGESGRIFIGIDLRWIKASIFR